MMNTSLQTLQSVTIPHWESQKIRLKKKIGKFNTQNNEILLYWYQNFKNAEIPPLQFCLTYLTGVCTGVHG